MKNNEQKLLIFVIFLLLSQISNYSCRNKSLTESFNSNELILVCGDSKVLMVDYPKDATDTIPNIIWGWNAKYAIDLPDEYRTRKFNSIDDCKPTPDGKQLMISSSSGAIAMISISDKKVTFFADVPNAHSVELLPDNKIIAAASTSAEGNKLMLFDIDQPAKLLDSDSLYSAHGIVWDKKRNSLFALGYNVLREYKIADKYKLDLKNEWLLPETGGHDLQMTPDGSGLLLTESSGVWIFHIDLSLFSKINNFPDAEGVKSLNQNKSGRYICTIPEESWWTYHVSFFNPEGSLSFPNMKVYKARLYEPSK